MKKLHFVLISAILIGACNLFSPEGTGEYSEMKLVFTRVNEIWLYDLLTKDLERLISIGDTVYTNEMGYPFFRGMADQASWSPDGKEIIFVEAVGTDGENLKVLNLETGEQRFFEKYIYRQDISPEWSADGSKIIFAKSIRSLGLNYEIFIVDSNGEDETKLTDRPFHTDSQPVLYANGYDILFNSVDNRISGDLSQIYHATTFEDSVTQLTFFSRGASAPQINYVTGEIIYGRKKDEGPFSDLWKVSDMQFTDQFQLTNNNYYESSARWSNDGRLIVYTRYAGIDGPYSNPEIWMMNADGSEQKMILENGEKPALWVK